MPFADEQKTRIRRRADMRCCVCRAVGVEIHHIVPQAEGGGDDDENGAPLCPSCHEMLGENPTKRRFIREARNNWYEVCDGRFAAEGRLERILEVASDRVTTGDLAALRSDLLRDFSRMLQSSAPRPPKRTLGEIIQHLFDFSLASSRNGLPQAEFLRMFIWDGPIGDDFDTIKSELINHFGTEITRHVCRYTLQFYDRDLTGEGFTDEDMEHLVNLVMMDALILLTHVDLVGRESGLEVGVSPEGRVMAWLASDASQATAKPH